MSVRSCCSLPAVHVYAYQEALHCVVVYSSLGFYVNAVLSSWLSQYPHTPVHTKLRIGPAMFSYMC